MDSLQVPVLNHDCCRLTQPAIKPIANLSAKDIQGMGTTPMILSGAHAAFTELWDDFAAFQKKVKDEYSNSKAAPKAKAKAAAPALKRVTDECSSQGKILVDGVVKSMFHKDDASKEELWMAPSEPAAVFGSMEHFNVFKDHAIPVWWAAGNHTSNTIVDRHMLGSLRIMGNGSRSFAAADFGLWSQFARHVEAGDSPPNPNPADKGQPALWPSGSGPNSSISHKTISERFRDMSLDRCLLVLIIM